MGCARLLNIMHGPECPYCGKQTNYGSTINGYPFECETCDIRFGNKGSLMHKDWRYMSDPDYTCLECGWSEKETRVSGLHGAAGIEEEDTRVKWSDWSPINWREVPDWIGIYVLLIIAAIVLFT